MQPIEFQTAHTRDVVVPRSRPDDVRGQFIGHRDFCFGRLRKRHTNGVADAIGQECTDTHGTFDASVLAFAGFRHTEVEREVHFLAAHRVYEQAHALHHHHGVRSFDRNHHVVKMHLGTDAQELHATLHNARWCVAITAHDAIRQATVIHTDAHCRAVGAANVEELHKAIFQARQFGGILLVGVLQFLERASRIHIIARIDAHFFHNRGRCVGHSGIKVHIGHEWRVKALTVQGFADVFEIFGLAQSLRSEPNVVGTGLNNVDTLRHARLRVGGECRRHALQTKWL